MRFYFIRNAYSAQIEASALVGLRVGFTCLGIALWPPKRGHRPWWSPYFHLSLWAHTGQCDQRTVFGVALGRRRFGYVSRGDATPEMWRYYQAGWFYRAPRRVTGRRPALSSKLEGEG
jgi:hypothetical protein